MAIKSAEHMRRLMEVSRPKLIEHQLDIVSSEIENASLNGKSEIRYKTILPEVVDKLKELGYTISKINVEDAVFISWEDNKEMGEPWPTLFPQN